MEEKIYVGSGVSKFEGNQVACSVCLSDLPQEHVFDYNGKKYIKLIVQQKREADQYGKTHYVAVDTWKPEAKKEAATESQSSPDLPF
jgi:heterodisulfide reductase subunit C|tara:strand:+ start:1260 stop:1520 length:261 start_codon:yes stop_codon:yes gene_type:complete